MREIKFRAWDIERGKYVYPKLWDATMPTNWDQFYIIEQYTGLKDKNGKEIYEGDIVKESMLECPGIVQYIRAGYFFNDQLGPYLPMTNANLIWEVIGNIHENPGLLT